MQAIEPGRGSSIHLVRVSDVYIKPEQDTKDDFNLQMHKPNPCSTKKFFHEY